MVCGGVYPGAARNGRHVAGEEGKAHDDGQPRQFGQRKEGLHPRCALDARNIYERQHRNHRACHQLSFEGREREKGGAVDAEGHREGRDATRFNHQQRRPAVKKSGQLAVGIAQIDVDSACFRSRRSEFGERKRTGQRQRSSHDPNQDDGGDGPDLKRHIVGNQEDSGSDNRADNDGDCAQPPDGAREFGGHMGFRACNQRAWQSRPYRCGHRHPETRIFNPQFHNPQTFLQTCRARADPFICNTGWLIILGGFQIKPNAFSARPRGRRWGEP